MKPTYTSPAQQARNLEARYVMEEYRNGKQRIIRRNNKGRIPPVSKID